jgi:hypothetical protein
MPPSALDRLSEFFKSLAGVITALVLLGGAIVGAIAFIKGNDNGAPTPPPPPPPSIAPPSSTPPSPSAPPSPQSTNASVFTNRDNGPGGTTILVSGEGFAPGERVVLRFHTEQIGSPTANGEGRFSNVAVTIPSSFSKFAPQQFQITATGESSIRSAQTPFTITG